MQTNEEFSQLIGDIYDAALDPARWVDVLRTARDFVGGSAATVFSKDVSDKSLNVYFDCGGVDPDYTRLYFDQYAKLDPLTTGHVFAEIEEPIATADLMPYEEFLDTRVYREWVRPQRMVDFVSATLDKSATGAAMLGVFRHERNGRVDDEARRHTRLIAPHIRRAMMIGRTIDLKTAEAETFADTLDGLSAGMFLVDESGRIVHANASGHHMLAEGSLLRAAAGRLAAVAPGADQELNQTLALAGGGDAAVGVKGIAMPLTARNGEHYVAHALPLTCGERRRAGAGYAALAALFVRKAGLDAPAPPEAIARLYKLTPSELRVLLAIVEVGGVPEVAEALGIGEATVKTHLHRLFAKTETGRQADLVKLVAGFSSPLVN
jgi:DNA-binding CsgD family transcriptional regulator/PAS domain-containing protein